jgi:pyruvate kinase
MHKKKIRHTEQIKEKITKKKGHNVRTTERDHPLTTQINKTAIHLPITSWYKTLHISFG